MKVVRFACVGGIGFLVDVATMFLLSSYIAPIPARGAAFWAAATSNWWLNRHITFDAGDTAQPMRQWGRFIAVSCIGFMPNWGCYWLLMHSVDVKQFVNQYPELNHLALEMVWPVAAMVPGVLLGMLTNYLLADRWVFRAAAA
ncbi:GtrA family protein [Psychromonas ossibalaenae]|uniref:GtrA family protein n=1 Tax=Psychromonas ossibalaenae TaxID=444922 RepID=UPI00035D4FF3|nr:GtrA family protein [Psychromonas ossibalaenae]